MISRAYLLVLVSMIRIADAVSINDLIRQQLGKLELGPRSADSEYPRANRTLRELHESSWRKYYDCLIEKYQEIGGLKTVKPAALVALEGTSVSFKCNLCVSPVEVNDVEWRFQRGKDVRLYAEVVEPTELVLPSDAALSIIAVQLVQAGRYWCQIGNSTSGIYSLTVNRKSKVSIVRPNSAPRGPYPQPDVVSGNLRIFTSWTPWSECSASCHSVGRKSRYGYCTLSRRISPRKSDSLSKELDSVLDLFGNRIPCNSVHVPKPIQEFRDVAGRKTEMMLRFCKRSCAGNTTEEILVDIPRRMVYQAEGERVSLECPGTAGTPVIWRKGTEQLGRTEPRVRVDARMRLVFETVRFSDAGYYECWRRDTILGVVRLLVTREVRLRAHRTAMLLGGIAILMVLLFIFSKAFLSRTPIR